MSEFLPVGELQTIGRAELKAVLAALNEVTMLKLASALCDSKYIVDSCNGQANKMAEKRMEDHNGSNHTYRFVETNFGPFERVWDSCYSSSRTIPIWFD